MTLGPSLMGSSAVVVIDAIWKLVLTGDVTFLMWVVAFSCVTRQESHVWVVGDTSLVSERSPLARSRALVHAGFGDQRPSQIY